MYDEECTVVRTANNPWWYKFVTLCKTYCSHSVHAKWCILIEHAPLKNKKKILKAWICCHVMQHDIGEESYHQLPMQFPLEWLCQCETILWIHAVHWCALSPWHPTKQTPGSVKQTCEAVSASVWRSMHRSILLHSLYLHHANHYFPWSVWAWPECSSSNCQVWCQLTCVLALSMPICIHSAHGMYTCTCVCVCVCTIFWNATNCIIRV